MKWRWEKLGLLYQLPEGGIHPKLRSHVANPLPVHLEGDVFRVFFSARDDAKRSSVGAVDIDIEKRSVERVLDEPVFVHGPAGSFYADGVSIANCYDVDDTRYMLFMGWQNPADGHWRGDIGRLRVSESFELDLADDMPLITSDAVDPLSLSYPWVTPTRNAGFAMWYGSTLTWDAGNGEMLHVINGAHSADGREWHKTGVAVPYEMGRAQAFSRPTVAQNPDGSLDMWFSYRGGTGQTYRIGHPHSNDAEHWELNIEHPGISTSADGWDSEMIEYPFVFDHRGSRYMLYNGNGFGKSGFGLARLVYE